MSAMDDPSSEWLNTEAESGLANQVVRMAAEALGGRRLTRKELKQLKTLCDDVKSNPVCDDLHSLVEDAARFLIGCGQTRITQPMLHGLVTAIAIYNDPNVRSGAVTEAISQMIMNGNIRRRVFALDFPGLRQDVKPKRKTSKGTPKEVPADYLPMSTRQIETKFGIRRATFHERFRDRVIDGRPAFIVIVKRTWIHPRLPEILQNPI